MRNANVNVGNKKRVVIPEGRNRGSSTHLSLRNETTNSVRGRFPSPSRTGKLGNDALFLRQVSSDLQTFNAPLYPGLQISGMTNGASGGFTPALVIPQCRSTGYSAGYKSGFTLIELLVVVLIIGILAAVALPQYNLAVAKARVNRLLPLMKSIAEAQNVYHMANGQYATEFAALDIDMPAGQQSNSSLSHFRYEEFSCNLNLTSKSVHCADNKLPVHIERYYSGAQFCWAKDDSLAAGKKLCKYICKLSSEIGANSRGCLISTPL